MRILILTLFLLFGLGGPVLAQNMDQSLSIAAVINDQVVSKMDVDARLNLLFISTDLPDTPEIRKKAWPQILRSLIDEKLQLQEAKKLNITVTEGELQNALARLAQQNNFTPEQLEQAITTKGGRYSSLLDQLRATIAWSKLIRAKFGSSTTVTQEEIDEALEHIKSSLTSPQYLLAEIALNVENPGQEEEVKNLADKIVAEIVNGAPFAPLARQFSQSPSAPQGGDLGWVRLGQLDPDLEGKIRAMQANQITKPIRTSDAYVILLLREIRVPTESQAPLPERDKVSSDLRQRKLEAVSRKYLRDLRNSALVDLRV